MSTRKRFEKVAQLIAIAKNPMMGTIINDIAKEVEDEFKEVLTGNEIMVSWSIGDVQSRYMDNHDTEADDYQDLTDADARDILVRIERKHDADIGINWTVIDEYTS